MSANANVGPQRREAWFLGKFTVTMTLHRQVDIGHPILSFVDGIGSRATIGRDVFGAGSSGAPNNRHRSSATPSKNPAAQLTALWVAGASRTQGGD